MANQSGFNPFINPATQAQIDRQRQMALMLQQQAMEPTQGQMVSGHYVAPSITQGLAKLLQGYTAKSINENSDAQQSDLWKNQMANIAQLLQGHEVPQQDTSQLALATGAAEMPNDASNNNMGGVGPTMQNANLQQSITPQFPTQQPSNNFTMANLLRGLAIGSLGGEPASTAYWKQYDPTELQKNDRYLGITPQQSAQFELSKRVKEGTQGFQPGQMNILPNGQKVVAPNFETGIAGGFDAQGNPISMEIPGSAAIAAAKAGAIKRAEMGVSDVYASPTPVATAGGNVSMTPAQQRAAANGGIDPAQGLPTPFNPAINPNGEVPTGNFQGSQQSIQAQINRITDPQERASAQSAFNSQKSSSGIPLKSDFAKKSDELNAGNMAVYQKALDDRVSTGSDLNMRLQEQLSALNKFQAGGGAETRAQVAQMAQAAGLSPDLVNKIAGGDLASMQIFKKNAAQTAMEQLKQAMNGAGRMTQAEFKVFQENNPNLSLDPNATKKIFDFQTKVFNRDLQEQQAFQSYRQENPNDTSGFPAYWSQQLQQRGFTNPKMQAQQAAQSGLPSQDAIAAELARRAALKNPMLKY